jgi:hypothetical protein
MRITGGQLLVRQKNNRKAENDFTGGQYGLYVYVYDNEHCAIQPHASSCVKVESIYNEDIMSSARKPFKS